MSNVKVATVREVQHNLASILEAVGKGQEIAVTKRGRIVARIVPAFVTGDQRQANLAKAVGMGVLRLTERR